MPTEYVAVKLNLSDSQKEKFIKAATSIQEKQDFDEVAIKVSKKNIDNENGIELKLTNRQYNKLMKSDDVFVMTFSKTQLKNQGSGIWDVLMSIGRKILPVIKTVGAVGKKVLNTGVGKVVTTLGKAAAEGAISGVAQDAVIKALNKPSEPAPQEPASETPSENTGGSLVLKINKDDYEKMLKIYECLRNKKIIKKIFTDEEYKVIKNAYNVVKNKIHTTKQDGGFLPLIIGALGSLLGNLFSGQRGSGLLLEIGKGLRRSGDFIKGYGLRRTGDFGTYIKGGNIETNDEKYTLIIHVDNLKKLLQIIKLFEDHKIFPKNITKTIMNDIEKQEGGFLPFLLGALGSLAGNLFSGLFGNKQQQQQQTGSGIKEL